MPIYEYLCLKCDQEFQVRRPMSKADEPALCPGCGSQGQKLISVFASKSGFYLGVPEKEAFRKAPTKESPKNRLPRSPHLPHN